MVGMVVRLAGRIARTLSWYRVSGIGNRIGDGCGADRRLSGVSIGLDSWRIRGRFRDGFGSV
jgi:hypothetical protein